MKYLCISPHGELEIWEQSFEFNFWRPLFMANNEMVTLSGFIEGAPEFWGREIIEEWIE